MRPLAEGRKKSPKRRWTRSIRITNRQVIRTSTLQERMRIPKARPERWVLELLVIAPEVELMAQQDPKPDRQDPIVEAPGDTGAADIVDRTGEQMPQQSHDGLEAEHRDADDVRDDDVEVVGEDRS
jgi:hypothetical protein